MKRFFILIVVILSIFFNGQIIFAGDCKYDGEGNISDELNDCLSDSLLVDGEDSKISGGFNTYIKEWTNNIALYLGVLAVLGIALGSFMLTISTGEDAKVSKAKSIIQWSIIGFIGVLCAALIINLIIRIMYSTALTSAPTAITHIALLGE